MNMEILNEVGNWVVAILTAFFTFVFLLKLYVLVCGGTKNMQPHPLDGIAGIVFIIAGILVAKHLWPYFY